MKNYTFVARKMDQEVTGTVRAAHMASARAELRSQDLDIVSVEEKKSWLQMEVGGKKVKPLDLLLLTRQLANYMQAGVGLVGALDGMSEEAGSPVLRETLSAMVEDLSAGQSVSDALEAHPEIFNERYRALVKAGEEAGTLDSVMFELSDQLERELETRQKVKGALTYPTIIIGMTVVVVNILVLYVLPKLTDFFSSFGAEPPASTRILMSLSAFMGQWGALIGLGLVGGAVGAFFWLRTEPGKLWRDKTMLRLPGIHKVVKASSIERFSQVLGTCLRAGVDANSALKLAASASGNRVFKAAMEDAAEAVLRGEGVAGPLARTNLLPSNVCSIIRAGEKAGTLDEQLMEVARIQSREVSYGIKKVTEKIEPIMMSLIGGIVGFVVLALLNAMYGSLSSI